ncbi:BamA/TamA family outer membrane protein [Fodinibius sediminis]|uniref:Surface antigen n=1 Tax=Fodinibius sediminis TaxID=1214077 RepID=A0A521CM61_9BACT|nr:BamA/TamA family outer membrane protein [Fodinibius sediminis]SMO60539.1 Surface antigen [Fodinibius sediminis]
MRKIRAIILFSLLMMLAVLQPGSAQDSTAVSESEYKNKILLLPAIGSSPETGFMFGAVAVAQFKMGSAGLETRSSSVLVSAIYTVKKQILLSMLPDIVWTGETWIASGNYFVNYFPESYWGVGPSTDKDDEVTVLYTQVNLEQQLLRQVAAGFFTGPYLRWSKLYNLTFEDTKGNRIAVPDVRGAEGVVTAGGGWIARWDRRNSNMTPTRNHFVQITLLGQPAWSGNSHYYMLYELDARKYVPLKKEARSVLALQALIQLHSGSPPFSDMALLGGDRINRGYYRGRYRDQNAAQAQAELRQNLRGRLGIAVFAATGEVWRRFENISFATYKWTMGAGLRLNLNREDPTNLRIDVGFNKESIGFYLQFGEAF